MKKLILILALCSSFHLLAQTATTGPAGSAAEKTLNDTLLNNSTEAQKIEDAKTGAPVSIKILSNKGSSSTKTSSANLTDQDKQLSENFVNHAGANKILTEKCVGDMKQACAGNEVDRKVMGMSPGLIKAIAQAYASMGAMGDIMPMAAGSGKMIGTGSKEVPKTDPKTPGNKPAENADATKKEKPTDYCKYIPAATETIAAFQQKNTVDSLSNGGETSQKEQLLKAAKSHDGRAKQAQVQAVGWYGGAACYAVNAATGNFAVDKNLVIRLAAATFLGTIYQGEVSANKEYAQKTRDIANSLPSKGDCNPVTENECYCSTPEYANDPNHCKEQIAQKTANSSFSRVACTDNTMKLDPACNCEKTNTCFDRFLENQGAAELQLGMGYSNSPFKSVASLAKGRLEGGSLGEAAFARTSAIAKKALNEFITKIPGSPSALNLNQKAVADALTSKGIPSSVSNLMASNAPPQSAIDSSMAKASALGYSPYEGSAYATKSNVLDFSGGNGLGTSGRRNDKKSGVEDLLGKFAPKTANANNAKVLEFAQKAQASAPQITKADRPLFEIISLRYQTSGRRLLQLDSNN